MSERYLLVRLLASVLATAGMSLLCAMAGKFYERRMTFLQHWLVAIKVWVLMALLALALGYAQFQLGVSGVLNSLAVMVPSVLGAFLTTRLARTSYGIEPNKWLGVGGKVFLTVVPLTLFLLGMVTVIWGP
jgi:hypothetical protein